MNKLFGALSNLSVTLLVLTLIVLSAACAGPESSDPSSSGAPAAAQAASRLDWAIAIHGGAGVIPKTLEEDKKQAYFDSLERALTLGRDLLAEGAEGLDVVEQVVRALEDDPLFNAGKGAVFTNELDAAIMDGRDLSCGAVSGLTTVKNPISLARLVMSRSRHIFFVGDGAEHFVDEMGVERVEPESPERPSAPATPRWRAWRATPPASWSVR